MCTFFALRCIDISSIADNEYDCREERPTMGVWLTCSGSEPCCLRREIKVLLCVLSGVESFELVGDAVGRLITIGPVVEDAKGAPFAYGVICESSNTNARGGTGGYRSEIKWGRRDRAWIVNGNCVGCGDELTKVVEDRLL
jgi:hypothetical protein